MTDEILACTKCGRLIYLHAIGSPYSYLWAVEWRGELWCQECATKTFKKAQQLKARVYAAGQRSAQKALEPKEKEKR